MMTSSMTSRDLGVKVMTPVSLRPVISKMARDRDSVTMGHLEEMACAETNGHVTDDVT